MRISPLTSLFLVVLAVPAFALPPGQFNPSPKMTPEMVKSLQEGKVPPGLLPEGVNIPTEPPADPTASLPPELVAPYNISSEFFTGLLHHDLEAVTAFSRPPFNFDGRTVATAEEIKKSWAHILSDLGHNRPTLYSLEIIPYDEMVKRFGPPPAKLSEMMWKGTLVALANLDGRAELAFLRRDAGGVWRVYGYSD